MYCTKCGSMVLDTDHYCGKCGCLLRPVKKRFCIMCGEEIPENSNVCKNCGTMQDESVIRHSAENAKKNRNALLKSYSNMHYSEGEMTVFNLKQCTILVYENRIEIKKVPTSAYLIGGQLGAAISSSVEAKAAASGTSKKAPTVTIPYDSIASYSLGKYGSNKTIFIQTNYGKAYSIALVNYRDEVAAIIESRR